MICTPTRLDYLTLTTKAKRREPLPQRHVADDLKHLRARKAWGFLAATLEGTWRPPALCTPDGSLW
jgi:hypothetical protein